MVKEISPVAHPMKRVQRPKLMGICVVLALCGVSLLLLTGCVDLKIIHADYPVAGVTKKSVALDKARLIATVDYLTAAHGFRKYNRDLLLDPVPQFKDTLVYSGSYSGGGGVFIHIIAKDVNSFPEVYVQGDGPYYSIIAAMANDILRALQRQFPGVVFKIESQSFTEFS